MKLNKIALSLAAVASTFVMASASLAQTPGLSSDFDRVQENLRREELSQSERSIFLTPYSIDRSSTEWGGWFNVSYYSMDDEDNQKSRDDVLDDLLNLDNRFWFRKVMTSGNTFYLRTKVAQRRYGWAKTVTFEDTETDEFKVDMAYLDFSAGPRHKFRVGRQFFHLGRGLVYSNVHDGISWNGIYGRWSLEGFISQSLPSENNLDYSVPGANEEQKRRFAGLSGRYTGSRGGSVYLYYMLQRDSSREIPEDTAQEYDYDSQYLGLGTEGFLTRDIQYYGELVRQEGKSYARGATATTEQIDAWGGLLGAKYYSRAKTHPIFSLEWAYGSGDGDRNNVITTANGNLAGTKDRNFLYFGAYDGGSALAPRLSNLSILRVGFSFKPFEKYWRFRNFSFSAIYSDYTRVRENGAISDLEATVAGTSDIGREIDLYLKWRIFSDVSLNMNYAKFDPGDAYAIGARDPETMFITSISFNY